MGLLHMVNCLHIGDVEVAAVADSSKKALLRASSLGVKNLYTDYRELIDKSKGLDAVIISLPNFLHFDSIKLALEAGLDVFIEKPMAATLGESREIVRMVDKTGRRLMVGHCMRYVDAVEKMKGALDQGRIGSLEIITLESIQNGPLSHGRVPMPISEWWFNPQRSGGGALLDIGSHMIDLFRFFAGDSKVLFSYLDHKYNLLVEDGATVILSSESGVRGVINIGWFEKSIFPKFNFRIILHGNADFISSDDLIPRNIYVHAVKEGTKNFLRRITGRKIRPLSFTYYYESYYKEMKLFCDTIKNGSDSPIPATEGLKTMEIIDEAYRLFNQKSGNGGV
jgi:predicted dehydrogenase